MKNVRVARRYAQALMAIAGERNVVDEIARDLEAIGKLLAASRDLRALVASPVIREGKKKAIFRELWDTRVDRATMAFLLLLAHKQREHLIAEVVEEFQALRDERQGILDAEVRSAVPLSAAQERELRTRLARSTGKNVRVRASVDPALRGGLVVRIGDTVVDASVRRQLERLRELLREDATNTHA